MLSITTPDMAPHTVNPDKIHASTSAEPTEPPKKKKKKRQREDEGTAAPADDDQPREKKKKRKHHDRTEDAIERQNVVPAPIEPAIDASLQEAEPAQKKKKKKKDKGKARADTSATEPTDAQIEADSQASAAALLSAIVAASVNNPENQQPSQQVQFQQPSVAPPGGQQFMQFPPMQYGYPPGEFDPNSHPAAAIFGPPGGAPFSDLTFGSNDDLLRALQDLDMSKIANALKTIGDASNTQPNAGSSFAPQLGFMPTELPQLPPASSKHASAASSSSTAPPVPIRDPKQPMLLVPQRHGNPDHAHLLATKWLTASKLTDLVKREGLVYKKGKFSTIEEAQINGAIERYQANRGMTDEQIYDLIFARNEQAKDTEFWSEITSAVPLRPIIAVYHYVRRKRHVHHAQGPWTPDQDARLKQMVAAFGQQWEKIALRVHRMASDCRDRYRNHHVGRETRQSGHWSPEEEEKLTAIVTEMTIKQGRDPDNDIFWGKVSDLMGGTRGRQQCRIKWTDALSKTVKNNGEKPRWSPQDAFILVHKIDSLNVSDDTEIDWKTLPDPDWNLWSAHAMQRRWLTLKKSVKGYEQMSHQEIMEILRVKKAHLPPPAPPVTVKKPKRKVTSAETVVEEPSNGQTSSVPEAGSSTGSGRAASAASSSSS